MADDDWTPLGFSSPGAFAGELVFAGYGIEAPRSATRSTPARPERESRSHPALRAPGEATTARPFDGKRPSRWSALRYKVLQARERGAAAVVFVTGPLQDEGKDKLPALQRRTREPGRDPGPAGEDLGRRSLASAGGIDLAAFQKTSTAISCPARARAPASP